MTQYAVIGEISDLDTVVGVGPYRNLLSAIDAVEALNQKGYTAYWVELRKLDEVESHD